MFHSIFGAKKLKEQWYVITCGELLDFKTGLCANLYILSLPVLDTQW
jgi:hypothetical protein